MQTGTGGGIGDDSPPRRSSLDRLYNVVGETVAKSLATIGTRLAPQTHSHLAGSGAPVTITAAGTTAATAASSKAVENRFDGTEEMRETSTSAEAEPAKEVEPANEAVQLRAEVERLRAEVQMHARAAARAARVVESLRVARDGSQGARNVDTRLLDSVDRVEKESIGAAIEKERKRARSAAEAAKAARRQCAALERVCMGLRSRLAVAEERAARVALLDKERRGRERAETELQQVKTALEKCEARATAAELAAGDTEDRSRAAQEAENHRETLEAELRSRDRLLHDMDADRARLSSYLLRYEDQFQQKEEEILELTRLLAQAGVHSRRQGRYGSPRVPVRASHSSRDEDSGAGNGDTVFGDVDKTSDGYSDYATNRGEGHSETIVSRGTAVGEDETLKDTRGRDEETFEDATGESRLKSYGPGDSVYDLDEIGEDAEMTQARLTNYP